MAKIVITQTKSGIGAPAKHRRTLAALGLKHQRSVVQEDTPAIQGMIFQVKHLVKVSAAQEEQANG